jgi:sarcosine oxidase, subunit gamma
MAEARSALGARSVDLARVGATEIPFVAQLDVRTRGGTSNGFPSEPNTWTRVGERDVLWLGPDEWLIVCPPEEAEIVTSELGSSLAGTHHSVVDVSANRAVLDLKGAHRTRLLSSACPIDLDPRVWMEGRCAQTLFGAAQVLLQERSDTTRLLVRPSFGEYVVDLLLAAAER